MGLFSNIIRGAGQLLTASYGDNKPKSAPRPQAPGATLRQQAAPQFSHFNQRYAGAPQSSIASPLQSDDGLRQQAEFDAAAAAEERRRQEEERRRQIAEQERQARIAREAAAAVSRAQMTPVMDVDNYYTAELETLKAEAAKGGKADLTRIKSLEQSLQYRKKELQDGSYKYADAFMVQSRLEPLIKKGLSFEDMAKQAGVSTQQVQDYVKRKYPEYGDQGLVKNVLGGVDDFVVNMGKAAAGIATKPVNALLDQENQQANLDLINQQFKTGQITGQRAMEMAAEEARRGIGTKAIFNQKTGQIEFTDANALQFGGEFIQQGLDTYGVMPLAGGVAAGGSRIVTGVTKEVLEQAAKFLTAGTALQAESKLATWLAQKGINANAAEVIGSVITSNAKQTAVTGTTQTAADIASGRGVSPESLALNYGADFAMGALPEAALSSLAAPLRKLAARQALTPDEFASLPPEMQRQFAQMSDEQIVEAATKFSKELPMTNLDDPLPRSETVNWTTRGSQPLETYDRLHVMDARRSLRQAGYDATETDTIIASAQTSAKNKNISIQRLEEAATRFDAGVTGSHAKFSKETATVKQSAERMKHIRDGDERYFDYDVDKVARERFDIPNLKKISSGGSDRDVYDLGDGNVLKIAKTKRGLVQNQAENDWYASKQGLIPEAIETGLNYVVAKKMLPPDAKTRQFVNELMRFDAADFKYDERGLGEFLEKWGMEDFRNYDVLFGDLQAVRNWGTHPETGMPIHVDGGTLAGQQMRDSIGAQRKEWNDWENIGKGKTNLDDPEFRAIYDRSRAAKKKFGDTDAATMYKRGASRYDKLTKEDMGEIIAEYRKRFGQDDPVLGERVQLVSRRSTGKKDSYRGSYNTDSDLITLIQGKADRATFNHESVHKAIAQFLDDSQIEQLYRDIVKIHGGKKAIQELYQKNGYDGISWRGAAEEDIANSFIDFVNERAVYIQENRIDGFVEWAQSKGWSPAIIEIFAKLARLLDEALGVEKASDRLAAFYGYLEGGGFAGAERRTTRYTEPKSEYPANKGAKFQKDDLSSMSDTKIKVRMAVIADEGKASGRAEYARLKEELARRKDAPKATESAPKPKDTIKKGMHDADVQRGTEKSVPAKALSAIRRELLRPNAELHDMDKQLAKYEGKKVGEIDPANRLTVLMDNVRDSNKQADALSNQKMSTGLSVNNLLHKYKAGGKNASPEWREFHTFLNQRFALEVHKQTDGKKWILGKGYDPADVEASINAYLQKNPGALKDAKTMKEWGDRLIDEGVAAGQIDAEFGKMVKEMYQDYVPLSRVHDNDLVRPVIKGGTGVTVGKQNVIRALSEGSQKALDDSPEVLVERAREVFRKSFENRFVNELYRRKELGLHKDRLTVEVDPDVSRRHQEVTELYDEAVRVVKDAKAARDAIKVDRKDAKAALPAAKANQQLAEVKAAQSVRRLLRKVAGKSDTPEIQADTAQAAAKAERAYNSYLKKHLDETGAPIDQTKTTKDIQREAKAAAKTAAGTVKSKTASFQAFKDVAPYADNLTDKEALVILRALEQYNPKQLHATIARIEKANTKLKGLTAKVERLKAELDDARAAVKDAKGTASELFSEGRATSQQTGRGQQLLQGFRKGDKMAIGIDADLAHQLEYLRSLNDDSLGNFSSHIAAPLKVLYTGAGAPVYAAKNVVRNVALAYVNTPITRTFRPMAIVENVRGGMLSQGKWYKELVDTYGYDPVTATMTPSLAKDSVDLLAARGGRKGSVSLYTARHPKQWFHALNQLAGRFDNGLRIQIARGEYQYRRSRGATHEQAMRYAAQQGNNALGNLRTVSKMARRMEALTPYSGATQAGFRAMVDSIHDRPVSTLTKLASIPAAVAGLTMWNLSQDSAAEYYKDAIEQDRTYELDSNLVLFLPWASPNEKGEWEGIIKVPVAPDFQPMVRAAWMNTMKAKLEGKVDGKDLAIEALNMMTADYGRNLYSPEEGPLPGTPLKTFAILNNVDPATGEPLGTEMELEQGVKSNTSDGAIAFSKLTGGAISPIQADAMFSEGGLVGKIARDGKVRETLGKSLANAFYGGKLKSDAQLNYEGALDVRKSIKDPKQRAFYDALHSKRTMDADTARKLGIDVPKGMEKSGMLDGATKALILLGNEEVLRAEMENTARDKAAGKPFNPLFDETRLTKEQRTAILTYRQGKIFNSAGQNRDEAGDSSFVALGLDEKWYEEFQKEEDKFFDDLNADKVKQLGEAEKALKAAPNDKKLQAKVEDLKESIANNASDTPRTFSGQNKPKASDELQAKLDYYYTLPRGTGDRSRYLRANPDIVDHWNATDEFTDAERKALGFKPILVDEDGDGKADKDEDGYVKKRGSGSGSYGRGGRGGSGSTKEARNSTNPGQALTNFGGSGSDSLKKAPTPKELANPNLSQYRNKARRPRSTIRIKL